MAEAITASFVMHGARDAIASGLAHVEQQVRSIELAIAQNPALAFDLARTLIESVCRTVLDERSITYSTDDDLPRLFRMATNVLPLLPRIASGESQTRASLRKTIGGLSTAVQGICELRNQCGFASHGSGSPRPVMEAVQALLAAQSADTIVSFIYRVHRQDRTPAPSPRALYDENSAFNESVDESHATVRIFDVEFRPSEVLFQMEPETYRVYLTEFDAETEHIEMVDSEDVPL